ncbi:hypothetical protein B0H13DRAFT_2309716 [Mycena leptocephala]|nr:hypothetical protein B0H13DRAFT_2309716 [Mycena leptocephala]
MVMMAAWQLPDGGDRRTTAVCGVPRYRTGVCNPTVCERRACPPDTVSALASALPARALVAVLLVAGIAAIPYCTSPLRLTRVLVATIDDAVETYIEAHGAGLLPPDVEAQMLHVLRLKASLIIEDTLRNCLSWRTAVRDFLSGESQLRTHTNLNPRAVSLLRRG